MDSCCLRSRIQPNDSRQAPHTLEQLAHAVGGITIIGKYIVVEGPNKSGKSSAIDFLKTIIPSPVYVKEPNWESPSGVILQNTRRKGEEWGMPEIQSYVKNLVATPETEGEIALLGTWVSNTTAGANLEALRGELFMLNRHSICAGIRTHLNSGRTVLADRSYLSSFVTNRAAGLENLVRLAHDAQVVVPDVLVVIYADPATILERIRATGDKGRYTSLESVTQQVEMYKGMPDSLGLPEDLTPKTVFRFDFSKGETAQDKQANLAAVEQALVKCGVLRAT